MFPARFSLALLAALASPTFGQDGFLEPKRIAAPPSDFGRLALPEPASVGTSSRAAMIPVRLEAGARGEWTWRGDLDLDAGGRFTIAVLAPSVGEWNVTLADGRVRLDDALATRGVALGTAVARRVEELGGHPTEVFRFQRLGRGSLSVEVTAPRSWSRGESADGFLLVAADSDLALRAHLSHRDLVVGGSVDVVARPHRVDAIETTPDVVVERATVRWAPPVGPVVEQELESAGTELLGSTFLSVAGRWTYQVDVAGRTADGARFRRTVEETFTVVEPAIRFAGAASARPVQDGLFVDVPVDGDERVQVGAQVWGRDADGALVPVAWLGGMFTPEAGVLPLWLDAGWLGLAGVAGELELRDVRLLEPNSQVAYARRARIAVGGSPVPTVFAAAAVPAPTPKMQGGQRLIESTKAMPVPDPNDPGQIGGRVLMLVHGYCSDGPWPVGQFTDAVEFQDFEQNRSHDEFAQILGEQAGPYDSFGVVAHSQGGQASLHLYTYYWSGLDYAAPGRLIQSLGSPYQGTALAGNAAILGQIFGFGCGVNDSQTYATSATWLAGIPTWARERVHYYTTTFSPGPFVFGCQFVVDFLLTDPEDGTTEVVNAQLPGANDEGTKVGWCHTTGMNFPPQTQDTTRNAEMDALAAR